MIKIGAQGCLDLVGERVQAYIPASRLGGQRCDLRGEDTAFGAPTMESALTGNGEPASFLGSRRTSWRRQASEGRRNSLGPRWPWEAPADSIRFRGTDRPLPPRWVSVSAAQAQEHSGSRGRAIRSTCVGRCASHQRGTRRGLVPSDGQLHLGAPSKSDDCWGRGRQAGLGDTVRLEGARQAGKSRQRGR